MADEPESTSHPLLEVRSLPREIEPPPEAEARIVAALRRERLLSLTHASRTRPWLAIAAALLLFVTGWAIGNRRPQPSAPLAGPEFALLLYGDVSTADGANEAALFDEYRRWAIGLRETGRAVSGQRLADSMRVVQTSSLQTAPERVRGFFLVSAASLDEAESIARTCPHAQRGGTIIVRPID